MSSAWKTLSSKIVYRNPWYSVSEDRILRPDGAKGKYYVVHKNDTAVAIPFDGKKIYLVNQFRYTLQKRSWELPMGMNDGKESILSGAKRELQEEAGFVAKKWTKLGKFACGPGYTGHSGTVYLAEGLVRVEPNRDANEQGMRVKGFTLSEIEKTIKSGGIFDSWTIVSMYYLRQYLTKK